jgi:hypothetical protein
MRIWQIGRLRTWNWLQMVHGIRSPTKWQSVIPRILTIYTTDDRETGEFGNGLNLLS